MLVGSRGEDSYDGRSRVEGQERFYLGSNAKFCWSSFGPLVTPGWEASQPRQAEAWKNPTKKISKIAQENGVGVGKELIPIGKRYNIIPHRKPVAAI